ncbi:GNAT family N-acetyltransferase [Pseudokineococcus sp. 1T1Z-3]|uniref:GNAT family N-acetyltransferase n=1 Tax=Pseudokineococcus sp. 1T1Z-3 TaxID=3132745 RepID=UPI0030A7E82D
MREQRAAQDSATRAHVAEGEGVGVRLHPLRPEDVALRAQLLALEPAPHQLVDSASARQTLPAADADPRRAPFAVLAGGRPVGFGVLDRGEWLAAVLDDPARAVLLRGFYLAAAEQGRGWGTRAAAAVPALAAQVWGPPPAGPALAVLTVGDGNVVAQRAYAAAGWTDTGVRQVGGELGALRVLVAAVPHDGASRPGRRGSAQAEASARSQ